MKKHVLKVAVLAVVLGILIGPAYAAPKTKPVDPNSIKKVEPNVPAKMTKYVGSKDQPTFHKADCKFAKNINEKNLVVYKTRDEAIKAGKQPCKVCKP